MAGGVMVTTFEDLEQIGNDLITYSQDLDELKGKIQTARDTMESTWESQGATAELANVDNFLTSVDNCVEALNALGDITVKAAQGYKEVDDAIASANQG